MGRDTFRRLWRSEGLRVRPRKAPKPRTAPRLQPLVRASAPGQVWAIDFQFDSDWKGRVFKVCNVIDEFTRQHLAFRVERRMGAVDVIEMLDLAVLAHGAPQVLRADNGLFIPTNLCWAPALGEPRSSPPLPVLAWCDHPVCRAPHLVSGLNIQHQRVVSRTQQRKARI